MGNLTGISVVFALGIYVCVGNYVLGGCVCIVGGRYVFGWVLSSRSQRTVILATVIEAHLLGVLSSNRFSHSPTVTVGSAESLAILDPCLRVNQYNRSVVSSFPSYQLRAMQGRTLSRQGLFLSLQ